MKTQILSVLRNLRRELCCYINGDTFCDCKYGAKHLFTESEGEKTGCPEVREVIRLVENLTEEQIEGIINKTYAVVPKLPPQPLLVSMALRYNHAFCLNVPDAEIKELRKLHPIMATQYLTKAEKESILGTMEQLHEEVVGTGFYIYNPKLLPFEK